MGVWMEIRPGVERKSLAVNEKLGIQADYIRIKPNHTDSIHIHDDFEWVYVVSGSFSDAAGVHVAGDFLENSTEGTHQPVTGAEGALLFIVWTGSVTRFEG